jgi:hypothetical protein
LYREELKVVNKEPSSRPGLHAEMQPLEQQGLLKRG